MQDFAYLNPLSSSAKRAFSEMIEIIRADRTSYSHSLHFLKLVNSSVDDQGIWMAGTGVSGTGNGQFDLILAPNTP